MGLLTINGTSRIVRDVEIKYTADGTAIATTSIVNSRGWKDKNTGEKREEACFIEIVAFGKTAEWMNQWIRKGSILEFVGSLQLDQWEDKNGGKRSKHTIRIKEAGFGLSSKSDGAGHTPTAPNERGQAATYDGGQKTHQAPQTQQPQQQEQIPVIDISEDEIPF